MKTTPAYPAFLALTLTREMKRELRQRALDEGLTATALVRRYVERGLASHADTLPPPAEDA